MTFHKIAPGKFKMGDAQIDTEITLPFEMMMTQLTQMMWARLKVAAGEKDLTKINPSNFNTGNGSTIVHIEGIDVEMKANHPVEQVSWDDVKEYINALNKLSGHDDAKTQDLLSECFLGHKKGDIYDLPTEAQWEFVKRNRGLANQFYFDRDDESEVSDYAWFSGNSGNQTHAVATRQPRMIDGKPFYDLEGNVWEWNRDWYDAALKGGKDPEGPETGTNRVIRGGSWFYSAQHLRSGDRSYYKSNDHYKNVGFRLVRYITDC